MFAYQPKNKKLKVAHIHIVVPNKFWDRSTARSESPLSLDGRKNRPLLIISFRYRLFKDICDVEKY